MIKNTSLIDRFLRYARIDTQSSEESGLSPSTEKQRDLAAVLISELNELGADVDFDEEHCYIYASLPGNNAYPALGFVAHMDTAPAVTGTGVQPRLIENYQGEDAILKTEDFPELLEHIGEDLIATDGTTLLGADDKAGVAEIMEMLSYYASHPEVDHRPIAVAFTPDEEIGEGTRHFDPSRFAAKEAYTADGGKLGELEYECFNAAFASVVIEGKNVHPGKAKGQMVNACTIAADFIRSFPTAEVPEKTEGYEGFYHLDSMRGEVEQMTLNYILRDFTKEGLEERKQTVLQIAEKLNASLDKPRVTVSIKDQYRNMREVLEDHMELIDRVKTIMDAHGVIPITRPIRGGTDGASLSFMGIPCPNLCTGGYNFHSRFEYASVQEMETCLDILIDLVKTN